MSGEQRLEALATWLNSVIKAKRELSLSEASGFFGSDEERTVQLARQGRVEAWEESPGVWTFDALSLSKSASEQILTELRALLEDRLTDSIAGDDDSTSAERFTALVESTVEGQYIRGRLAGWHQGAEFALGEIEQQIADLRQERDG